MPTYMSTILGFDMASNAVLSAVPFLVMWIYSIILGSVLDHLGSKGIITRTTSTKIATSIGESAGREHQHHSCGKERGRDIEGMGKEKPTSVSQSQDRNVLRVNTGLTSEIPGGGGVRSCGE